jgi:hypothetical protein
MNAQMDSAAWATGSTTGGALTNTGSESNTNTSANNQLGRDIEGGFGGQEGLYMVQSICARPLFLTSPSSPGIFRSRG